MRAGALVGSHFPPAVYHAREPVNVTIRHFHTNDERDIPLEWEPDYAVMVYSPGLCDDHA